MQYCNFNPRVKDKNGNERDSKLWGEIMELTNDRAMAKKLYAMYNDPAFKSLHKDDLNIDDAGEPSLESCLKNFAPTTEEERNAIRDAMLRKEGLYDEAEVNEGVEKRAEEYRKIAQKVKSFNERSPYAGFASAYIVENDGKFYLNVAYGSKYAETLAKSQAAYSELLEGIFSAVDPSMHDAVKKIFDGYIQQGSDIHLSIVQTIRDLLSAFEQDFYKNKDTLRARTMLEAGRNAVIKRLLDRFYQPSPEMTEEEKQNAYNAAINRIAEHILSSDLLIENMQKDSSPYEALKKMLDEFDKRYDEPSDKMDDAGKNLESDKTKKPNDVNGTEIKGKDGSAKSRLISAENELYSKILGRLNELRATLADKVKGSTPAEKARIYKGIIDEFDVYLKQIDDYLDTLYDHGFTDGIKQETVMELLNAFRALKDDVEVTIVRGEHSVTNYFHQCFDEFIDEMIEKERISNMLTPEIVQQLKDSLSENVGAIGSLLLRPTLMRNTVIQMAAKLIKDHQVALRKELIEYHDRIARIHQRAKEAGLTDFSFMYALDSDGKKTGNYIGAIDYEAYYAARWAIITDLLRAQGMSEKDINNATFADLNEESIEKYATWEGQNVIKDKGHFIPNPELYRSNALDRLTPAQKEYYDSFMEIRSSLMKYMPEHVYMYQGVDEIYRAVQQSGDLVNRMQGAGLKKFYRWPVILLQVLREKMINRTDDADLRAFSEEELGDFKAKERQRPIGKNKRENKLVNSVPLFFIKRIHNLDWLTTDTTSALMCFTSSVLNYHEMNKIVDLLQLAEDRLVEDKNIDVRTFKTYQSLLKTQIYKIPEAQVDKLDEVSTRKIFGMIQSAASLVYLGLNAVAGASAALHDATQVFGEAVAGEYFNAKDLARADAIILGPQRLFRAASQAGSNRSTDKLSLFSRMFNVRGDFLSESLFSTMGRRRLFKAAQENSFYIFMNLGAAFGETRVALARCLVEKVLDSNGKRISLWDALEVYYVDKDGKEVAKPNGWTQGKMRIKAGVTRLDGSAITDEYLANISDKWRALNENLYGVYSHEDMSRAQNTIIGAMMLMFRKFLVSSIDRRYHGERYDAMSGQKTEGFYTTTGRFMLGLVTFGAMQKRSLTLAYKDMSKHQRRNLKRAFVELALCALSFGAIKLFFDDDDDDKKYVGPARKGDHSGWSHHILKVLCKNLHRELTMPTVGALNELKSIIESPSIIDTYLINLLRVLMDLYYIPGDIWRYITMSPAEKRADKIARTNIKSGNKNVISQTNKRIVPTLPSSENVTIGVGSHVQGGRINEESRLWRDFKKIIPFYRQVERVIDPESINTSGYYNNRK